MKMGDQIFTGAQPSDANSEVQPVSATTPASGGTATTVTDPASVQDASKPAQEAPDELAKYRDSKSGLFFGKYKSAADAFAAHEELRKTMGRQGNLMDTLRSKPAAQPQSVSQPQSSPQSQPAQPNTLQAQLAQLMSTDPVAAMMYMAQMTRQQTLQDVAQTLGPTIQEQMLETQVARLTQQYPDFAELREDIQNVLSNQRMLAAVKQDPTMLEGVYWMARGRASERLVREARERALAEAAAAGAVKPGAGPLAGANRPQDNSQAENENILKGIFDNPARANIFK